MISLPTAAGAAFILFLASVLRGFTGFGFGLAATPMLALLLPPSDVVPVVLILQIGSSFLDFPTTWKDFDRKSTLWLSLAAMVATPGGVFLLRVIPDDAVRIAMAMVSIAAVCMLLPGIRWPSADSVWSILPVGLVAGALGGLCAMPGPPVLAYYMNAGLAPAVSRASMILVFLATSALALLAGAAAGLVTQMTLLATLAAIPFVAGGSLAGAWLFRYSPASLYRQAGIAAMLLIAAGSAWRVLAA